ncbi:MAG TPA: hypothetical protein VL049_04630 [Candidatus Dormibacteraeota bacterium]|nr:hypothetical protein [Candidatus Dormibacteraeota bacterium]
MPTRLIADSVGLFSCEIEVTGPVLSQALELHGAEEMLHSGLTVVLAALAQGPPWPERVLDAFADLMVAMREHLVAEGLS